MAYTLYDNLKRWAEQYETAEFIQSDSVQIPHRYDSRVNIEISAFVTAWIAWGSRKQIIQKADFIDREIFKGAPYHYIVGTDTQGAAPEWKQYKGSKENFYRTFTYADFYDLCARLFDVYSKFENMEKALKAHPIDGLHNAGLLEPGEFVVAFAKVLDKRETKLSRAERDVIHTIGMTAFNKTMKKLIADEKARNNSNGDNKQ